MEANSKSGRNAWISDDTIEAPYNYGGNEDLAALSVANTRISSSRLLSSTCLYIYIYIRIPEVTHVGE